VIHGSLGEFPPLGETAPFTGTMPDAGGYGMILADLNGPSSPAGVAGTLQGLLEDEDAVVRQRSAHTLGLMACKCTNHSHAGPLYHLSHVSFWLCNT